jgi:hypothetical protein
MVAGSKYAHEAPALVAATKARTDLSKEQRDALDDIASTVDRADGREAMRAQDRRARLPFSPAHRASCQETLGSGLCWHPCISNRANTTKRWTCIDRPA